MLFFYKLKMNQKKKREKQQEMQNRNGALGRERRFDFSLKIQAIRPSAVFGTRRRTALRGEGYAWTLDL